MARDREFDPEDLLTAAVQTFWKQGYAETSMRDIVKTSGIAHAGIYNAFGNKRDLYIACMRRYNQRAGGLLLGNLNKPDSSLSDIHGFFEMIIGGIESGQLKNGCLMGNTVVEFGPDAKDIIGISRKFMDRMSKSFEGALERAQNQGEINRASDTEALAQYLTTCFYGLMTMVRSGASLSKIRLSVSCMLVVLK